MHKMCGWLALVMAAGLFVTALTPMSALAHSGDRPIDLIDPIGDPGPVQYGDPDPGTGGRPLQVGDFFYLQSYFLNSLRLGFLVPSVQAPEKAPLPQTASGGRADVRALRREMR